MFILIPVAILIYVGASFPPLPRVIGFLIYFALFLGIRYLRFTFPKHHKTWRVLVFIINTIGILLACLGLYYIIVHMSGCHKSLKDCVLHLLE